MAQKLYKAQVAIPSDTALPEDKCVNTFHFAVGNAVAESTAAGGIRDKLLAFYQAIDNVLYPVQIASPAELTVYDLTDAAPRSPVLEDTIALTPSANPMLPAEVAVCLSYQGAQFSGIPQTRRRGRIFLGPIQNAVVSIQNSKATVDSTARTTIATAASTLAQYNVGLDLNWVVYSPTSAAFVGDISASVAVDNGWIDDAFDTIRSRGTAPSERTTWT